MKKYSILIILKVLFIFYLVSTSTLIVGTEQLSQLIVTYEYPNYSIPFVVALDNEFFLEEGVKIAPRKIGTGVELDMDEVDIINGHDFYLLKKGRGFIFAVHPFSSMSNFEKAMLVKKSAGIYDWKDLKGKSIVITDIRDFSLLNDLLENHGLKGQGLEGRDVTIKSGGGAINDFPNDKDTHALYGWSSTVLPLLRQYPGKFDIRWRDLGKDDESKFSLVACSYIKKSTLTEKRSAVKAYVKAIDRAIDLIREDPKIFERVLPKYFDVKAEWARNMEVYEFHKSEEIVDYTSLSKKLGIDVEKYFFNLSELIDK